jgi:hypothetical protein
METLSTTSVIHYFVARSRETLCGLRGFEHRSTKHARSVTCPLCVGLLRERLAPETDAAPPASAEAPAPDR